MKSKTIILSSENNSDRGILTLAMEDDLLKCKVRLYNLSPLNSDCKIGIYHQKQTYSSNLIKRCDCYESSLVGDFDMDKDFYCALVDTSCNNAIIVSGGTYAGYFFNNNNVFDNLDNLDDLETNNLEDFNQNLQGIDDYNSILDENGTNTAQNCNDCDTDKCANCKYKEYFYSSENKVSAQVEQMPTQSSQPVGVESSLLTSIIPQFNYIFENYTADDLLNKLISNGKFVKIEDGPNSYSLGAIYENDEIKYICYATKKDYNQDPPEEIGKNYQWLPLDQEDPLSEGYYIVYQDAKDLKILQM